MTMCKTTDENLMSRLRDLAFNKTTPFCDGCNRQVKPEEKGFCKECSSDDLMRCLEGDTPTWDIGHIVQTLISSSNLTPVNGDFLHESTIDDCYGEFVTVGYMTFSTAQLMKENDPIMWDIGVQEGLDNLEEDGEISSLEGGEYYHTWEVESFLDKEGV